MLQLHNSTCDGVAGVLSQGVTSIYLSRHINKNMCSEWKFIFILARVQYGKII